MAAPVRVGEVVAGKFEVVDVLGSGGMGVVVAARHRVLENLVALKFMHDEQSTNAAATQRFLCEARAANLLQNEHICRILDADLLPSGVPYIVMEYLEGKDLGRVLEEQDGPLPVADAVEYVLQACEAMVEAHAHGIIHRDLKPQNLFLTSRPDGRALVKVLDFGISKIQYIQGPTVTRQTIGSPPYMAPEQIRSPSCVDARADLWSLGVILYQLLSRQLPFTGDGAHAVMYQILEVAPQSLGLLRPDLPAELIDAVNRCLHKEAERRFSSAAELMQVLIPFAPERTNAAMSLVDQVKTSTHAQRSVQLRAVDTNMTAVPDPFGRNAVPTMPAAVQTTCGSAASSNVPSDHGNTRDRRSIAMLVIVTSLVALVAIALWKLVTSNVAAPATRAAFTNDILRTTDGNTVDALEDMLVMDTASPTGGPLDAAVADASEPTDAKPTRRIKMRNVVETAQVAVPDAAAHSVSPDAAVLEPARSDDEALAPAR